jgi:DNA-binding transcriptional LysR family regulator
MDRLEAMSIVLGVAETGSLSAAARRLNTPAATASRKITELEAHLRAKLFDRTSQKLTLTATGSTFVAAAKRILSDLSEAERAASGEYTAPTGELILTAPVAVGRIYLMPILAEFLLSYPEIDVRLLLDERVFNLVEEQIDLALRVGVLPDSRLISLQLGTIRGQVMCASPAYLAFRGTPRVPEDLTTHDCIIDAGIPTPTPSLWTFVRDQAEIAIPVRPRLVVPNVEAACDAARAGIGITRALFPHIAASVETGTLVTLLDDFQTITLPVNFVYAAGPFLPIKVRAFLDFAAPHLKPLLARGGANRPA